MTIKPVVAPTQKRVAVEEKKESHTHSHAHSVVVVEPGSSHNQSSVRSAATHSQCRAGQSPQRRGEVYDDLARHRRSPHKSTRSKRREHHDHHNKRERVEREKHGNVAGVNVSVSSKCGSPHVHGVAAAAGVVVSGAGGVGGVSGSGNVVGGSSPSHVGGGKSPEHLAGIPVVLGCQSPKSQTTVTQAAANLLKAVDDTFSGYNSGDEHLQPKEGATTADEWQQRDEQFAKSMSERGYVLKPVEEDGACLFRAISLQIYGDEEMHDVIRQHTMDYIYKNREYFSHFVTEDINSYIKRKRRKDSHGNHIEIQAMSEIYSRPVEVYCYKPTPINIFNSEQLNNGYAPLRLSYQRGSHYNAIIDPYNATVGVGLGLPAYKPELQTKEAVRLSEQLEIEQTMFEDKLKTTDWEATNEAIEEQIARESYLQWCRENLHKSRATTTAASTSATVTSAEVASDSEASPSKYSVQRSSISNSSGGSSSSSSNGSGNKTTTTSANAAVISGMGGGGDVALALNGLASTGVGGTTATVATAAAAFEHSFGLSPKSLSALAHNLKKNASTACDLEFDSDDTDMSSTSSIGAGAGAVAVAAAVGGSGGAASPSVVMRGTKTKKRSAAMRASSKKRRREHCATTLGRNELLDTVTVGARVAGKSPKRERGGASPLLTVAATTLPKSRSHTPDVEQRPCTSKQSSNTPVKHAMLSEGTVLCGVGAGDGSGVATASVSVRPSSSTSSLSATLPPSSSNQSQSSFYQELLEASYAGDGYGQLTESEMLQRAIRMSTQDYIEDQKRKYLYMGHK